jgi:4-amino-4-deoxy-L-arabinose transferase-like glycosyltransferase
VRLPRNVSPWTVLLVAAVVAGALMRAWVLQSPLGALDADEAIVGLMARHALEGEFSAFYWLALYGGPLEAWLTAPVFWLFGSSTATLRVVPIFLFALAAILIWLVGRRTVGERGARLAAALYWISPAYFIWWSTKSRGYFATGLVLALLATLLLLRLSERDSRSDAAALGLVLGLAWWTMPQVAMCALPLGAWLLWKRRAAARLIPFAIPTFVLGAAPLLAWNVTHDWNALFPSSVAGDDSTYLGRFVDLFRTVLPTWLGVRLPFSLEWLVWRPLAVAITAGAVVGLVLLLVRRPPTLAPLLVVAAAFPFLYAFSTHTFFVREPRYLVVFAPVPALLGGWALARLRPVGAALGLACVLALSVVGLVRMEHGELAAPRGTGQPVPADLTPLLDLLRSERVHYVLANYWIAYRISFESDEQIIATSTGFVRYQPHDRLVRNSEAPVRVFIAQTDGERLARPTLLARGDRRLEVDGFVVYLPTTRRLP